MCAITTVKQRTSLKSIESNRRKFRSQVPTVFSRNYFSKRFADYEPEVRANITDIGNEGGK